MLVLSKVDLILLHFNFRSSHPVVGVLRKRCSGNILQIYRRTPKVATLLKAQSNFIEITHGHRRSPVSFLYIFRTPFPNNTSG